MYVKITPTKMRADLRALVHGQQPRIPIDVLAQYTLNYCTRSASAPAAPKSKGDSVEWCERLYALEDTRQKLAG